MAAKNFTEKDAEKTISKKVSEFLSKQRILLISIPLVLILIAGIYGAVTVINNSVAKKDFENLDTILFSLEKKAMGASEDTLLQSIHETKQELQAFVAKKKKGAASARASMALGGLEFEEENYAEAMDAYLASAEANKKAYTASVAYYNAAICAEELGQLEKALEIFEKAKSSPHFALVPQTLFNMGRIALELQDKEAAKGYFQALVDKYSNESWANLAKSQLLLLETEENL
ncbi:MAG TPA: tetratricopeptide repeat protein [Treponemataceae bacterium]|nr:tetratricopeptide repeat protein [Treponemataceae bacterium]